VWEGDRAFFGFVLVDQSHHPCLGGCPDVYHCSMLVLANVARVSGTCGRCSSGDKQMATQISTPHGYCIVLFIHSPPVSASNGSILDFGGPSARPGFSNN
jgi:hypothetical protein